MRGGNIQSLATCPDLHVVLAGEGIRAEATNWSLISAGVGCPTGSPTPSPEPKALQHPENPNPPMPRLIEGGGLYRTWGPLKSAMPDAG